MVNKDGLLSTRDYLPQPAEDGSSAEALKHTIAGSELVGPNAFSNIVPHEFRFEDTSGSGNAITWRFVY